MILHRLRETYWQAFHNASLKALAVSCLAVFIGFVCSRALLSIGMAGMVVAAILNRKNFSWQVFHQRKELLLLTLLFWGVALSGLWSSDKHLWLNFARIHLPFLFLPLAFAALSPLTPAQFNAIAKMFVGVMTWSAVAVLANYLLNFEAINESMLSGGVIPMPFSHIRYSLMLVFACCAAINFSLKNQGKWWMAVAIFLFLALHVFSVRSGLFALYTSLVSLIVYQLFVRKKVAEAATVLLFVIVAGIIAFSSIPSLKKKIAYMKYDFDSFQKNELIDASDGMRFRSWEAALQVAKSSPLLGVGYGDLQDAMSRYYIKNYPQLNPAQHKLPHNQFLWWMVSVGWTGLILFSFVMFYPALKYFKTKNWLWHAFLVIVCSSFVWEATLEEQMGTGFVAVWMLLLMQQKLNEEND